ncbi:hypothetical protein BCR36DRAFT_583092 [Piromyces finnis]|uniref:C3H1-type domain-containing protein n=1 Tax=Piromyces finnis TaxID=1754191 RepID=A0A1Y1VC34_9FUNG|nr:hypothetical protein BCR36DRAFT_583092 [Piromyces finnis]|eukprot:ORX51022.1 hypothetical protein BCR36DRAFT_583092 [Piromyces finnis]
MADNYSMFSALSDVTEDLSELTLKMESQEFKEKKHKSHSVHNLSTNDNSSIHSKNHRKNNSNASNLLSPPWEKKHNRRSLSDGGWNIKKENPTKTDKNEKNSSTNTLKTESKDDLSRTPSLPSKWSIKRATLYKTELCRAFEETGKCKFGDECIFAHSEEELRPRVDRHPKYKTRICRTFWEQGECPYGKRCCFIHTERDITHPDDFSVFEAQMQQQLNSNLSASSLLNGSHRRMQSAPEIVHKHRPSNSSDTFMGGIYAMTPLDRRSLHSEKSSIRSFDTTKETSKLKEEIKISNGSSDEESASESGNATPSVVLMDETGSITEIIKKPKKTQRITKLLKVGHKSNNNTTTTTTNSNNNLDVNLIKSESAEGKNKSKWFSRNKNNQNKEQKEKKSKEESTSTGRKILSFGRKDKDKEKDQNEKPEKEKYSKFFPFVRHNNNDNNEAYSTPSATPPPLSTYDFPINTNGLSVPPPLPSPPLEKTSNLLAADALFGNTEPATQADEKPKTEEVAPETKDKKKNKNLIIDASQPIKIEEVSSPRRFIPNFLLSAISKSNSQKEKEEK